jgi:hypothetical protein
MRLREVSRISCWALTIGIDDILDPAGGATHQTDKDRRLLQDKEGCKIDGKD